jgi:hypothetical protein
MATLITHPGKNALPTIYYGQKIRMVVKRPAQQPEQFF